MSTKLKSTLTLMVKIVLAVALIGYMVRAGHLDPKELWAIMTIKNVVLAFILVGLITTIAAWRWILLMRGRGLFVSLRYGFSLYLIGIFFNHALPGSVGGDVVRGYYLVNDFPHRRGDAILSVVIDRILGLYSFFILTLIAVAWDFEFVSTHLEIRFVALICFLIFSGMTLFFTVTFSKRLSSTLGLGVLERRVPMVHKFVEAIHRFGENRRIIVASVAVSLLCQLVTMTFFYQVAIVTGETDITWKAVMFAVPMGFLVTAVPIAPAGIGVGQVAFSYLFKAYLEKDTQFGATSITAYQLTVVCWALIGAIIYLSRKKPRELESAAVVP